MHACDRVVTDRVTWDGIPTGSLPKAQIAYSVKTNYYTLFAYLALPKVYTQNMYLCFCVFEVLPNACTQKGYSMPNPHILDSFFATTT